MDRNSSMIVSALAIAAKGHIYATEISEADLQLLKGDGLWVGGDRLRMLKAIDTMVQGGLTVAGIPAVNAPAELLAAAIACCVSPVNWFTACAWLGESFTVAQEARGVDRTKDSVGAALTPRQLYGLVLLAFNRPESYRTSLMKKLNELAPDVQPEEVQ